MFRWNMMLQSREDAHHVMLVFPTLKPTEPVPPRACASCPRMAAAAPSPSPDARIRLPATRAAARVPAAAAEAA